MQAFRGALLHFLGDPDELGASAHEYFDDGLLVLHDGKVLAPTKVTAVFTFNGLDREEVEEVDA